MNLFNLSFLTLALSVSSAFSMGFTKLMEGDVSISQAKAELLSLKKICPNIPGGPVCRVPGSIAKIRVTMTGCMNRFGGYVMDNQFINEKGVITFTALNINNKKSASVRCIKMPHHDLELQVMVDEKADFQILEYNGSTQPAVDPQF